MSRRIIDVFLAPLLVLSLGFCGLSAAAASEEEEDEVDDDLAPGGARGGIKGLRLRMREKTEEMTWVLFPGLWSTYGKDAQGAEVSLLYKGVGAAVGYSPEGVRYLEAEVAIWFLSLGAGYGVIRDGESGTQLTWAAPWLPIFPYGRLRVVGGRRHFEHGLMLKVPVWL